MSEIDEDIRELLKVWPMGWQFGLPPHSVCVVAGAYKGRVMDLLHQVYKPARILGYEPQPWALERARARVGHLPSCELYPYGLGTVDGTFEMGEWETDACSFVNHVRVMGMGELRRIETVFPTEVIDLAVINMEGYEFNLLPHMVEQGMMDRWLRLAVQFHHGFGNDAVYPELRRMLARTHDVVIDQAPQWVYWRHRSIAVS